MDIKQLFTDYLAGAKIFNDREHLSPDFIPGELLHRDQEVTHIAQVIFAALRGGPPSNILMYGTTGTGKTASVKYIARQINQQCEEVHKRGPMFLYLNCQEVNTPYRIFAQLCNMLVTNEQVPFTGLPTDAILVKLTERLEAACAGTICIVVLDEIDILVKKSGDEVLYHLTRINGQLRGTKVAIIGISNVLSFKDLLSPRVVSSLSEEEILFPPYDASELHDILMARVRQGFNHGALEESVVPLCAAIAAREHGDARKALALLKRAGELAERRAKAVVTEELVYAVAEDMTKDCTQDFLQKSPLQSRIVLLSIFLLQKHGINPIKTGQVYATYCEIYRQIEQGEPLTLRRVTQLLKELALIGLISADTKSEGRRGRTTHLKIQVPLNQIKTALEGDIRLGNLLDFVPKIVRRPDLAPVEDHFYKKLV